MHIISKEYLIQLIAIYLSKLMRLVVTAYVLYNVYISMSQKQNHFPTFNASFMYLFDNYLDLPKIPANHHHVGLELLALSTQSVTLSVTANLDLYPNLTPLLDVDLHLTSPLTIHTIGMDNEIHPFLAEVF